MKQKKIDWKIIGLILFGVVLFYFYYSGNFGEVVDSDKYICPREISENFFYGFQDPYSSQWPIGMQINEGVFFQNKGSSSGFFSVGSSEGENVDYMYSSSIRYERFQKTDVQGFILPKEVWDLEIVFDYQSCEDIGPANSGEFSYYRNYRCELVSVECSKK